MITEQQIRTVLDHPVHDADGHRIGKADHLFLDDMTGKPEWVSVKTGWFGTSESFVPIRDARIVDDHLEVPYPKATVKDAPNVDVDGGNHLSAQEEHRLYDHYGIAWDNAWHEANQPGDGGWAHSGERTAATGAAGAAAATAGTGARAGTAADQDDAMTRSEERMTVGTERHEAGRARLRKYVVEEEQQRTVPVRHEEVRVEREPITEANRDAALAGEPIGEAEHEVVLHEERPVVRTEAVPVERVRLTTEELVEQETVTGTVRKERIEAELPEDPPATGKDRRR
ncbi:PRC and DUF2382 domain-containing protein [Kitasatospora sp. NPDC086009]|uniref:PRC and DUF2382 domain-containing protein n=1 Tax=unclassified Kitasatospora TaxID=2633591 RepID=UPI0037C88D1E